MRAILTVFLKEFRENLRERRTLLSALLFGPLLTPLLFAAAMSLEIEQGSAKNDLPVALAVSHSDRAPNLLAFLHEYGDDVKHVMLYEAGPSS
jgi:sodium transport system permease protein